MKSKKGQPLSREFQVSFSYAAVKCTISISLKHVILTFHLCATLLGYANGLSIVTRRGQFIIAKLSAQTNSGQASGNELYPMSVNDVF